MSDRCPTCNQCWPITKQCCRTCTWFVHSGCLSSNGRCEWKPAVADLRLPDCLTKASRSMRRNNGRECPCWTEKPKEIMT